MYDNWWACMEYQWKSMNMYRICMKVHEDVQHINENQCKRIEYVSIYIYIYIYMNYQWKVMNMYRIWMKTAEFVYNMIGNQWQYIEYVWQLMSMYEMVFQINEHI